MKDFLFMKTKILRFEQDAPDTATIDKEIAKEVHRIENEGFIVFDVQLSVGRDSSEGAKRYAVTVLLLYDEPEEEESEE